MLPIPNFRFWEGGVTPEFCKEATIYLLDAEKGRFCQMIVFRSLALACLKSGCMVIPKVSSFIKTMLFIGLKFGRRMRL